MRETSADLERMQAVLDASRPVRHGVTDVEDRVRGLAADVVGCAPDRIIGVHRFATGERHHVFRVSPHDGDDLVVRVSLGSDDEERAAAEREARVLEVVHGGAAPRLLDFRLKSRWFDVPTMCLELVPGEHRELAKVAAHDLERLGAVVGSVHALPVTDLADWFPDAGPASAYRRGRVEMLTGYRPWVRDPLPASMQRRLADAWRAIEMRPEVDGDEPLVLLHGDIAGGNVLWAPSPVLIDWEYARPGDAADEIAYLFSQSGLMPEQRDAFWRGYSSTTDARDVMPRVEWWEPLTLLGSALWWIERWTRRADADAAGRIDLAAPREPAHYLEQAMRRLEPLERLLDG
ncbi:MAG TPA: phosphotransferase [Acidimicrobiales bacterium]|nr:phosphotransferase [Acidimicrobiales bacterium]